MSELILNLEVKLNARFDKIDEKLDNHDKQFKIINQKLDDHDKQFNSTNQKIDNHESRLKNLEHSIKFK